MAKPLLLWLQQSDEMRKLNKPSKTRIVKQKNGDWYLSWYCDAVRHRAKLGLNRIKNLELRQLWAQRIVDFIDGKLYQRECISENDIPTDIIPTPHDDAPDFERSVKMVRLFGHFEAYIEIKKLEGVSDGWMKKLKGALRSLQQFAAELGKMDFDFMELNRDWVIHFKAWRFASPREHGINHVSKDLSILRSVLTDAEIECELDVNPKYKSKAFQLARVQTDEIALTMAELQAIADLDLSHRKGRDLVRDNFVFGALTALRYSDWAVEQGHIVDVPDVEQVRKMISVITLKTKQTVLIPLAPVAIRILEKYDYNIPSYTNQKSNEYLKEIAKLAGLDKEVKLKRSKAGKVIVVTKKQYEVVKTHTARRTFVTIALFDLKIPPQYVMKITGHKTEKQLMEYARIGGEVAALEVARAMDDFFKT